jgi:uncharacterized membrane protein
MSIFGDYGYIMPWEIIVALIAGALVLYLGIRATRRADRRYAARQQEVAQTLAPNLMAHEAAPPKVGE